MFYEVDVVETVTQSRTYIVSAHNEREAREKAERGDTVEEYDSGPRGDVLNRDTFDTLEVEPANVSPFWDDVA